MNNSKCKIIIFIIKQNNNNMNNSNVKNNNMNNNNMNINNMNNIK